MTLDEVKKAYTDVFVLPDDRVLDLVFATMINMYVKTDPLWLLIVGAPSSGKSEVIQAFYKVPKVFEVSDITENSFLSGMRDEQASLLHQIGKFGVIAMKDFTSILAYRAEKRENIMGQMRQIYDGYITKKTGTGKNQQWRGKINLIGGVTEDIYIKEEEGASMGRRTILYKLPQQDRMQMLHAARTSRSNEAISIKRERIQEAFAQFVQEQVEALPEGRLTEIDSAASQVLLDLANFATSARTPINRDKFTREITFIHDAEMPIRVSEQLHTLAEQLQQLHGGTLPPNMQEPLWKICFDSIPKIRFSLLKLMAEFDKVSTKGAAIETNLSTATARRNLEDLDALKIIDREAIKGANKDYWSLKPHYKDLLINYAHVPQTGGVLDTPDGEHDEGMQIEQEARAGKAFDDL